MANLARRDWLGPHRLWPSTRLPPAWRARCPFSCRTPRRSPTGPGTDRQRHALAVQRHRGHAIVKPRSVADVPARNRARAARPASRCRRRRPARDGRAAVRRGRDARGHAGAQPRAGVRRRARRDHRGRRHPVAAAARSPEPRAGGRGRQWGIYQKQTGADRLSIGGALSCNAHGRGLNLKPIVQQVEAFDLLDPTARFGPARARSIASCSGSQSAATGCSASSTRRLRLRPRVKVRRVVDLGETATGSWSGSRSGSATATCTATTSSRPIDARQLSAARRLLVLSAGARRHAAHRASDAVQPRRLGEADLYSHTLQAARVRHVFVALPGDVGADLLGRLAAVGRYVDNYHADLDRALGSERGDRDDHRDLRPAPAASLHSWRRRAVARRASANVIYGTVRLIERTTRRFWRGRGSLRVRHLQPARRAHAEAIARPPEAFRG